MLDLTAVIESEKAGRQTCRETEQIRGRPSNRRHLMMTYKYPTCTKMKPLAKQLIYIRRGTSL